jgi:putative transposase
MYKTKKGYPYCFTRHGCFFLRYHIVFVTKERKPVLDGVIKTCLYSKLKGVLKDRNVRLIELDGERDYVHLLVEADPSNAPGELASVLKIQSSRFVRKAYGKSLLLDWYEDGIFWAESYFVCIADENSKDYMKIYLESER